MQPDKIYTLTLDDLLRITRCGAWPDSRVVNMWRGIFGNRKRVGVATLFFELRKRPWYDLRDFRFAVAQVAEDAYATVDEALLCKCPSCRDFSAPRAAVALNTLREMRRKELAR